MTENLRFFNLLSRVERKYGLSALDASSRAILDLVVEREVKGLRTTASDIIEGSDVSRASVYRKISELKTRGHLQETWSNFQLVYSVGEGLAGLYDDVRKVVEQAGQPG